MTRITLRPKGETTDRYDVTGEVKNRDTTFGYFGGSWTLLLAPGMKTGNVFYAREWEEVPPPFVFPTKRGAVISGMGRGTRMTVLMHGDSGDWWSTSGNRWEEDRIRLTDLRIEFGGIDE